MVIYPWLRLRQARELIRSGQLDEARQLLARLVADKYKKALQLQVELAKVYLVRAERHLRADDADSAWRDLILCEKLDQVALAEAVKLRQTLTRLGLAEMRAAIEAGKPNHAAAVAVKLREAEVSGPELDNLEQVAKEWKTAASLADRGEFSKAEAIIDGIISRLEAPIVDGPCRYAGELSRRKEHFDGAIEQLTEAANEKNWGLTARTADVALSVAPDHREARSLRAKAWGALSMSASAATEQSVAPLEGAKSLSNTVAWKGESIETEKSDSPPVQMYSPGSLDIAEVGHKTLSFPVPIRAYEEGYLSEANSNGTAQLLPFPKRFRLWIDDVENYLVCLGNTVSIGQSMPDASVDLPVIADLARFHAELHRDNEGYVFESGRDVAVNGRPLSRSVLNSGDRLTLGSTCQLLFTIPVGISRTAVLEFVSGHGLPMAIRQILLMADALVIGGNGVSHVSRKLRMPNPVTIYRTDDGLGIRYEGRFSIDGRPHEGRAELPMPCCVETDRCSFSIEPDSPRL